MSDDSEWAIGTGDGPNFLPFPELPRFASSKAAARWARDHAAELRSGPPVKWRRVSTAGEVPTYREMVGFSDKAKGARKNRSHPSPSR